DVVWEKVRAVNPILNLKEKKFFYVAKTFDVLPGTVGDLPSEPNPDYTSMLVSLVKLEFELRLMRLFKEGDIRVLNTYAFSVDASRKVKKVLHGFQTNQLTSRVLLNLTDEEIPELREFLKRVHLPFPQGFLQLAFSLFENSYGIREP